MAVCDVAPTLYEFAGIDPNKSLAKKPVLPMIGVSFKRYLTGEVQSRRAATTGLNCIIRRHGSMANGSCDGWCRAASPPATRRGSCLICTTTRWRRSDVAAEHPDRVKAMSEAYEAFAKRTMVTKRRAKGSTTSVSIAKTGRYLAVDPATMKPVPAPQAIL
ncbi:hypothetical protein LNO89_09440 [Klebsiella pneumoniae subsp. pneumoniae]|nr:hypothetical protein [Klebsiella pneumoniae subsp. pneumoniae]